MYQRFKSWARAQTPAYWFSIVAIGILTLFLYIAQSDIRRLERVVLDQGQAIDRQAEQLMTYATDQMNTEHEVSSLKGQMVVLDTAVNADKKRKARIGKVKESIKAELVSIKTADQINPEQLAVMATAIVDSADAQMLPVTLLMGLIRRESAFNPNAVSKA